MIGYESFLESKRIRVENVGIDVPEADINPKLFPFQRAIVCWALKKARAAVFLDCGLGKTFISLEWARILGEKTLIVAPLSVARQTVREGKKIDVDVKYVRAQSEVTDGRIFITNYDMVQEFDPNQFDAVVLDESSILKAVSGKIKSRLISMFSRTKYRLCCTATPAPNDHVELGNHAHFLGMATTAEMLSMFFVNANKQQVIVGQNGDSYERKGSNAGGQEWRIKHHAEAAFFRWLASWAVAMAKPSDLGFSDDGFVLPDLNVHPTFAPTDFVPTNEIVFTGLHGIADRIGVRRRTCDARLHELERITTGSDDQWIVWCGLDAESKAVHAALPGSVEVRGSDHPEEKARAFEDFQDGKFRVLVTKAKIGGHGMNFQCAHQMAFFGLSDSWESYYQAIRREWRYGQREPVHVHVIMSELEAEVYRNVMRKELLADRLRAGLVSAVRVYEEEEFGMAKAKQKTVAKDEANGRDWRLLLGDSCERLREIPDTSIDLSIYSPPFMDLFVYSATDRDVGNCRGKKEFFEHYGFVIREVLRATKPGRLTCVHTSDIPAMQSRDGYIGLKDFPGDVIRAYEDHGWTFVGRAFVQKNPQAQAIRVKSKALLFVQLRKDSSDSRPALVDQILFFKAPGENAVPVRPVDNKEMDNETWIEWANGIWVGISESDTLNVASARAPEDEKHICPLQLGTIERCLKLYSNPGELVLSPFAGIGSEGYVSLKFNRKFIGIELKESYWRQATKNLHAIEGSKRTILDLMEERS